MAFGLFPRSGGKESNLLALQAQSDAREARTEIEAVRHDIQRLQLVAQALWTLLKKEHGYDDAALTQVIAEIEASGDDKAGPPVCPNCGRILSRKHSHCMYCGQAVELEPFAR